LVVLAPPLPHPLPPSLPPSHPLSIATRGQRKFLQKSSQKFRKQEPLLNVGVFLIGRVAPGKVQKRHKKPNIEEKETYYRSKRDLPSLNVGAFLIGRGARGKVLG
jgi:hypothetical protein